MLAPFPVRLRPSDLPPGHTSPIPPRRRGHAPHTRIRANSTNTFTLGAGSTSSLGAVAEDIEMVKVVNGASPRANRPFVWATQHSPQSPPVPTRSADARFALKGPLSSPIYGPESPQPPLAAVSLINPSDESQPSAEELTPTPTSPESSAMLNVHGGLDASRRRHHPYHRRKVPYPRSYERTVIDLHVFNHLF
ncbi:hypothetical protein BJ138DRAFT_407947 [Hygrophoropsis aurantiaca]|uniref:Uncharacterized protein n=1 Tax=Hygrophoropsis aurantiaca TaxID=72124 RepID=A0ACB8A4S9_9AGAM|nr:hypothetical protein BJ138DRAFT_407947 [Hygrophoropsis aurantiaca]